jgi:hypothetical protein
MSLGACRLKRSVNRRIRVLVLGLAASLSCLSCGKTSAGTGSVGTLPDRVLASQGVSGANDFGGLVIIDGYNDTIPRLQRLSTGNSPGLMTMSPSLNIAATFDSSSNSVYIVNTATASVAGNVHLPGSTSSMVFPTSNQIGYAAVPSATVIGKSFVGAVESMNFPAGQLITIAVTNAQTVVSNSGGSELLVFSNDSDAMTVLFPANAVPPVDTSCLNAVPNQPVTATTVCAVVTGFDRPVYAVVNGNTAYILNCGPQCGGVMASVMVFDLPSLTVTSTIPVDAATWALLNGSTLYVVGTSPTNNACTGETTAATTCGRLDIIDVVSGTVTGSEVITDGYHDRMDFNVIGQLFIGSHDCTNIGNVNFPNGEVRGCLSIYSTADNSVLIAPDNGDVNGLQAESIRPIEYVAQGGYLRVYAVPQDILFITDFIPQGTIPIVGYVGDVKSIDLF